MRLLARQLAVALHEAAGGWGSPTRSSSSMMLPPTGPRLSPREAAPASVSVNNRQIGRHAQRRGRARRGGGVAVLRGRRTLATAAAVREAVRALRRGAVGGGCVFHFDGRLPLWPGRACAGVPVMRLAKLVAAASLFCTRRRFQAVVGFCERYYAAEGCSSSGQLKRRGRFVVRGPASSRRAVNCGRCRPGSCSAHCCVWRSPALAAAAPRGLDVWYGRAG